MKGILVVDAARRIGVTQAQVERLVKKGRLHVLTRTGSVVLLDPDDVTREAKNRETMRKRLATVERM